MPVGFSSAARNLFLLGSTGAQVVTNFFKTIDQSAGTDGVYIPDEIKYNSVDQKYVLSGSAQDSNSKGFGWFEKRDDAGTADFENRIESTQSGINTTLRAMELDSNDNLIVVGKTGNVPWIAKYSNGGVIDWQSTTNSADVEYTGVTSDSNGQYYACGNTPTSGQAQAFVEKFDANGNPGWGKSAFMLGRDVVLKKIDANSKGEVVAVGYLEDDSSDKGYIVKIDTNTGEVLWDRTLYSIENGRKDCICNSVFIDSKDQIYIVGEKRNADNTFVGFIIKYTAEGNMIWQKEIKGGNAFTTDIPGYQFVDVKADGETEQVIAVSQGDSTLGGSDFSLYKFSKNGSLIFSRRITSGFLTENRNASLDADPSFYYLLFTDQITSGLNGTPDRYIFGKVSSSGNGLGDFQYDAGQSVTIDYEYVNTDAGAARLSIIDGRISDGSVRNDTSDLITYPFNGTKILFDDLATQITNKKRQMDGPDSFEYSGSPAIRPADFQELNLLGDVYSGSGNWLDQSGKGNDAVVIGANHIDYGSYWQLDRSEGNNTITIPYTPNLAFTDAIMSCEAWIYVDTFATNFFIINKRGNNVTQNFNRPYVFDVISDGRVRWILDDSTTLCDTATGLIQTGQWYHLAATHDGTNAKIYINGVENVSVSSGTSSLDDTGDIPVRIGHRYQNTGINYSDGRLGDVRLYSRALTAAQVFQNYNATKSKYINEAPDTAPKIGPGIVYDSNLLLNYDFGNRATYDRAENLATWSEDFNNSAWKSTSDYSVEVDSSVAVAPDGTTTADYIYKTNPTNAYTGLIRQFGGLTSNTTYTFSFYHKAKERDIGGLYALEPGTTTVIQGLSKTTTDVGNGWKRTYGSLNIGSRTSVRFKLELATGSTWTGTQGYYLWGGQLEKGSNPGRYIKTSGTAITAPTTVKNLSSTSYPSTISGAVFNSSGYFVFDNANNDEIITSQTTVADTGMPGLTVEVWANLSSSTVFGSGGRSWIIGEEGRWRMTYDDAFTDGGFYFACATTNNGWFTSGTDIFTYFPTNMFDRWNHLVGVYDGSNLRMYYNGNMGNVNATTISGNVLSSGDPVLSLMGTDAANVGWGTGSIGQVRIYSRGLTTTEVFQNFNATRSKYGV